MPDKPCPMLHYPGLLLLLLGLGAWGWFSRKGHTTWDLQVKDTYVVAGARQVTGLLAVVHLLYAIAYYALLHDAGDPVWGQLQFNLSFLGYWFMLRIGPKGGGQARDHKEVFARTPRRLPPLLAALICFGAGHLVFVAQLLAAFL